MDKPEYRVWIVASQQSDFLAPLRWHARTDDIFVLYNPNHGGLSFLGGYRTSAQTDTRQLANAIDLDLLNSVLGDKQIARLFDKECTLLSSREWSSLKKLIVSHDPSLAEVIEELERRQLQKAILTHDNAVVYDALITPLRVFWDRLPDRFQEMTVSWRRYLFRRGDEHFDGLKDMPNLRGDHSTGFDNIDQIQDPHHREIAKIFRLREQDSIDYDYAHPGIGLAKKESPDFPSGLETQMYTAVDKETGRELIVYMAHRKGYRQADLLNADLIYESVPNRSFVLVQYKRFSGNGRISPQEEQLFGLLNLCSTSQRCANEHLASDETRLYDCPVYYKLLDATPRISYDRQTVEGLYITACQLAKLASSDGTLCKDRDFSRCLHINTFFELLRTSQIGSNAHAFERFRLAMREHMQRELTLKRADPKLLVYAGENLLR